MAKRGLASVIAGVGSYVPEQIITNKDVNDRLNGLGYLNVGNLIEKITGVKERRYAPDGIQASDLGVMAAKEALEEANLTPEDIDTILFTSCSRDLGEPSTASIVQSKLGAVRAERVMDVANACNSFLSGLEIIDSMVSTGLTKVGLVVSGEKLSTFVDWSVDNPSDLKAAFAAFTLGDGGGAMIVTENRNQDERGINSSHFFSDGTHWNLSVVMGGGTISPRNAEDSYFRCDSLKLNSLALKYIPLVIERALEESGYTNEDIDLVVPHQVSYSVIEHISKRFNYPIEKIMVTLDRYGNIGAASVPIALGKALKEGKVHRGSRIVLVVGAAGFSAGSMVVTI